LPARYTGLAIARGWNPPAEAQTVGIDSPQKKIGAGIAAGIAGLAVVGARVADNVLLGSDDALRGSRGGAGKIIGAGDSPRPPRPSVLPPPADATAAVGSSVDNGAATLDSDYGAFPAAAREASRSMACDTIFLAVRQGRPPNAEEWVVIVESAFVEVLGVTPPVGSAPWRSVEEVKNATAAALIDPSGEVDTVTAEDLVNDLACTQR
jgi:hypothetical protein